MTTSASPATLRFSQVDVFSASGLHGNPVAVVHDADGLAEETMGAFARWTNLSETTFLLRPTDPAADYRVRIFTTGGELPFAGHPTLGSAHAWLEAGGVPRNPDRVVQECGVGLVPVRRGERLAFAAPPLLRSGPVDAGQAAVVRQALGLHEEQVLQMGWVDNGPGWVGIELVSAQEVLAVEPVLHLSGQLKAGLVGRWPDPEAAGKDVEVRAFYGDGVAFMEDPVTGSLNAGLAQWLVGQGRLPDRYVAGQGSRLRRDGRVYVVSEAGEVWVGGDATVTVRGQVLLR
ncbi:PhzF family phenazine biosynthesis protein [Ornithinimicrobium pratense]|uniref:PhzF family phenazine biosynthesis protein n=1 Tax=Ornithinimicrobium pratense TaxID=2593973 RepID=A0A5J6V1Z9_9MICO|nr:PhzF family phenazine biosynthesis protein [Ornithinimicrobium pratense]QFG67890.1 PhzF family phenazine biosynthesis protein [Ornithinimicrobium pratense]